MPKESTKTQWTCVHCNKVYDSEELAVKCEESHEYVYVKLTRLELKKLIEFLYTGNFNILPKGLTTKLVKLDRLGL